jgi:putative tryptophan/tyrosine transport system substrate-binding protein
MRRREFIAGLGGAAAWPVIARAQQTTKPIVGILTSSPPTNNFRLHFSQGLAETGFVDGQNVTIEMHSDGQYDRLPAMAAELVRRHVNVILSNGVATATLAAKNATATIPIVFITGSDPVQWGFVASYNRPGGNLTGMTILDTALLPKRLELLREVVPNAALIGLLLNPNNPNAESQVKELDTLVRANGLKLKVVTVRKGEQLTPAFESLANDHADAVLAASDALLGGLGVQIVALAGRYKLPVI